MTASAASAVADRTSRLDDFAQLVAARPRVAFVTIAALAALLYELTVPGRVSLDAFVPLADAFLHGRLHVADPMPWIEHVDRVGGGWYVPYPPMPAITVLPFVALFGAGFDQGIASALVGGLNVAILWTLLGKIGVAPLPRLALAIAFAVGTVHWWAAGVGTSWLFAGINGVFYALLALWLALDRRWPILAGVLVGCAAASRLPVGLTLPLYLAMFAGLTRGRLLHWPDRAGLRDAALVLVGLAGPMILVALYNVARFGSPFDFGYEKIGGVLQEPWYAQGILSLSYIPRHIEAIFFRGFDFVEGVFPYFRPNWMGLALTFSTPLYFWLVNLRRDPFVVWALIAVALALVPIVTHGNVGEAQFGYRFSLDVAPLLFLLLGTVFRERISRAGLVAILVGIAVNAYGVIAITVLNFVSY
ncbi:MAG: hypothetical protein ACRDF7_08460 [Candidatus Limnocylindrales bacterium]